MSTIFNGIRSVQRLGGGSELLVIKQERNVGLTDPTLVPQEGPDRVPCIRWVRVRLRIT
jgi:hypothetical protein